MGLINQNEKTLVFCANQAHALLVRDLINQLKTSKDPNYCQRVTANDGELGEKITQNTEETAGDCYALDRCALQSFLLGEIDDRTLWAVLTTNTAVTEGIAEGLKSRWDLTSAERKRVRVALKPHGPCRPLFDWQSRSAVDDGHAVLGEDDTRRFGRFITSSWKQNDLVWVDEDGEERHFQDFDLVQELHGSNLRGICLVHYYGP